MLQLRPSAAKSRFGACAAHVKKAAVPSTVPPTGGPVGLLDLSLDLLAFSMVSMAGGFSVLPLPCGSSSTHICPGSKYWRCSCRLLSVQLHHKSVSDWVKNGRVVTVCGMDSDVPFCVLRVEFCLIFLVLSVANWPCSLWRPSELHSDHRGAVPDLGLAAEMSQPRRKLNTNKPPLNTASSLNWGEQIRSG